VTDGGDSLLPDREAFCAMADSQNASVVYASVTLDVDVDPLTAYAALSGRTTDAEGGTHTFLLESAEKVASSDPDGAFSPGEGDRHARYSFVGYDPAAVVTVDGDHTDIDVCDDRYTDLLEPGDGDVLDRLQTAMPDADRRGFPEMDREHFAGGLVGFLAYDAVYDLWLDEHGVDRPQTVVPDAQFALTTETLVFDDADDSVSLVFTPVLGPDDDAEECYDRLEAEAERVRELLGDADAPETGGFRKTGERTGDRGAYEQAVEQAKEHVLAGDVYQAVVSRSRELRGEVDPLGLYESLRTVNPSPYMYLLDYDGRSVVGASPETLVAVRGDTVVSNPLAGTCERGPSPVEDRRLAGELLADDKERAEHTMLVDLARNDVRRVARPGSVEVAEFMKILKYSHVQHIESTVTGELAAEADAFDAVRASFPAGTLSGAPKVRAMEVVDDLESSPRGLYGGGVGYVSWTGDAEFAIVIRTATIDRQDEIDRVTVRAGAGVVADSDPAAEYDETEQKMDGVLAALERITDDSAGERVRARGVRQ
jgi:anthranilate synthase component 1